MQPGASAKALGDSSTTVKPVFIKGSDLSTQISVFELCTAVAKQVGHENVFGSQQIRGLWRIYLTDLEARKQLITNQLTIQGHQVHVYDDNPFRAGLSGPDDDATRVTVKDMPLSYGHAEVSRFFEAQSIKIRRIEFSKARDKVTKELSKFADGDRVVYTDKIINPLPRNAVIAGQKVRIFHEGQDIPKRDLLCTKCLGKDHTRSRCKKPDDWCKLCQAQGHKAGEETCPSTTSSPQDNVRTIYGHDDPLSNHFPCTLKALGQSFSSVEHAYKHTQAINAGKPDMAAQIAAAANAAQAKAIAKSLPYNPQWEDRKEEVMRQILQAKLDQVQEFKYALRSSNKDALVGSAAGDYFWGSGLSSEHTRHTKQEKWPGENKLGVLLTELRSRMLEESALDSGNSTQQKSPNRGASRLLRSQSSSVQPNTLGGT